MSILTIIYGLIFFNFKKLFAVVVPFSQSFDDFGFTYKIPDFLIGKIKSGFVVEIPFGKKILKGVVIDILEKTDFEETKLKEIIEVCIPKEIILDYQTNLLKWISKNYFTHIHNSLGLFLPKNLEEKINKNKFKFSGNLKQADYIYNNKKELTLNQNNVFESIVNSGGNKFLIYGVTGSGKTEIYINLIKKYLDLGKQSLLLVPEIILNDQIFERIKSVFGKDVLLINSTITQATKTKYWESIYSGNAKIVVGTRSSIFYPYSNLGIIIMDEEHDNSYISDSSPRYNSLEVINQISDMTSCKIVLGSATPNIVDMYDALGGKYKLLNLFEEY